MKTSLQTDQNVRSDESPHMLKPKVLFLAYYFPPRNASGSVRTWNIALYLAKLGWDVTVVTPDPSVWKKVEDPEKVTMELQVAGIKRILTGHQWCSLLPNHLKCWNDGLGWIAGGVYRTIARRVGTDSHIGWVKSAERACSRLNPRDVDIILASGAPFIAFKLAKRLADRLGCPYVLDYRDPWTGNPHKVRSLSSRTMQEEANLLQHCAAVTVVSPSWGIALNQAHSLGSKLHVVSNGYNPDEMAAVKPFQFGHCAFVYAGIFYPPKRVISPFLAALKQLRERLGDSDNSWHFHYYGISEDYVREQADQFGLTDRIVLHGRVSRRESLSAAKGARLAVVITSIEDEGSLDDQGIVTGKIFEAIGVGTPVLLIAPNGSDATTTTENTGLVKSFTGSDVSGMASYLEVVVRGQVTHPRNVELFSWASISKTLDGVLRKVVLDTAHT